MIRAKNRILRSAFCVLLAIIAVAAIALQYTAEGVFAADDTPSVTTTTSDITPPTHTPTPHFTVLDGKQPSDTSAESYDKLFDNITEGTNKYCVKLSEDPYVVFKSSSYGTTITGYKFYTAHDTATYPTRNPAAWTLYGCNDYDESAKTGTWTVIHDVTNDTAMGAANNTPYSFTVANATAYKYFKFEFTARRGLQEGEQMTESDGATWNDDSIQLSEIQVQATVDTSVALLRTLSTVEYGTLNSEDAGKKSAAQNMYDGDLNTYCTRDDVSQIYWIKPPTGVVIYGARVYLHSSTVNNSELITAYFKRQTIESGETEQFGDFTAFTKKDYSYTSADGKVYTLFVDNSTKHTVYSIRNEWIPAQYSIYVAEVEPLYRYECEHSFTADYSAAVEATCTQQGVRAYRSCDYGCGVCQYKDASGTEKYCESEQFQYEIAVPCIEHTFGEWTNAVEPSCTQAGCYKHRQCTDCSTYEYVDGSGTTKTCASDEYDTYICINKVAHVYATTCQKKCSNCPYERPDSERVHVFDKNGSAALVNNNPTQHTYFCTNANCPDGALNEDHIMVLVCAQDGAWKHWYECSKEGCPYETSKTNCVIKYESKDATHHVSYCEIDGERHELGTNGAQNTDEHSWELTFKQDKYDAGEGAYHDNYCEICGAWKGEETACTFVYKSNDTEHWHECTACKKSDLNKQAHSFAMIYDYEEHWENCTVCNKLNGDNFIEHAFESETSTGCSEPRCGYQRFLSADISVSGYAIDAPISGLTFSGKTDRADTNLTLIKYTLLDSDAKRLELDRGFKFRPNSTYYAVLAFDCGDVYPSLNMTAGDFSLPKGFEFGFYEINIDDSTNNVTLSVFVTLPALGGVSAEKSVSEMEIDFKGFVKGKTFGDLTIGITCKGLPTDKSFIISNMSYHDLDGKTITETTIIENTCYGIYMTLTAPDGFNFFGLTDSGITVKNDMGIACLVPMTEGVDSRDGKTVMLCVTVNGLVPEHVCGANGWYIVEPFFDYLCPDTTKQHSRVCKNCGAMEFVNHVYTEDTETQCDECGYTRTLKLDEMRITLTGYESDAQLSGISATYSGSKYSDIISVPTNSENAPMIIDLDTRLAYSKKATFVPGKAYGLMLEINVPNLIDISGCILDNVYVNGTKVKVVTAYRRDNSAFYVLELPAVKGESKQTKVSDVTLEVSGFVSGHLLNDVSYYYNDHPSIAGVGIIVTENGNAMSTMDAFTYGVQYVLKVTYFLKDGYYGTGVTAADLKVSHYEASGSQKTVLGSFECIGITVDDFGGQYDDKRTIICEYLVVLKIPAGVVNDHNDDHIFPTENPEYHTDESKHYVLCGCGARAEGQAHVYEDGDPFTCAVCGYVRVYSPKKVEIKIGDWHVGNSVNIIGQSVSLFIDDYEVGFNEYGEPSLPFYIGAMDICEGKFTLSSVLEQLKAAEVILAGKSYAFLMMVSYFPDYLDLGVLTEKDYIIKGIGKTDITASVVENIDYNNYSMLIIAFNLPEAEAEHIHGGAWIDEVPASYTEAGTKGHYVCTVCGDNFDAENVKIDDLTIAKITGYNLIFTIDGKQVAKHFLVQGSAVTYPTENTSREGFTFAWSQMIETMPNEDVTIEGVFSVDVNYFKGKVTAVQSASTVEDIYSAVVEANTALALYKDVDTQAISADIAQLEALVNRYKQTAQNAANDIADTLKAVSAVFGAPVQTTVVAFTADIGKRRLL